MIYVCPLCGEGGLLEGSESLHGPSSARYDCGHETSDLGPLKASSISLSVDGGSEWLDLTPYMATEWDLQVSDTRRIIRRYLGNPRPAGMARTIPAGRGW